MQSPIKHSQTHTHAILTTLLRYVTLSPQYVIIHKRHGGGECVVTTINTIVYMRVKTLKFLRRDTKSIFKKY